MFSLINISCLAIGITFSLLIGIFVLNEKGVNADLKHADNQYILKSKWKVKGLGLEITTLGPLPRVLKDKYPSLVANYYRYNPITNVISAGDLHFKEDVAIGDTGFVSMYGFKLLYGDADHAFKDRSSAVITQTMARKLFDKANPLGKTISLNTTMGQQQNFTVSAVLKDLPKNSITNYLGSTYNVYLPYDGNRYYGPPMDALGKWTDVFEVGMIELRPGVTPKDLEGPIKQLLAGNAPPPISQNLRVELAPVRSYYLQDNNGAVKKMTGILSLVAGFILLMAIINFTNINIGTSNYRLKEIGLRKVFGGSRKTLVFQYLIESIVLTCVAALISLLLYALLSPLFNQMLNTELTPLWRFDLAEVLFMVILTLGVGIIAGLYPAFVLSASNTVSSVKGKINSAKDGVGLRKVLLVVQFTIAVIIFVCALNVSKQVEHVFDKDLGYNKDQVMVITAFPKQWDSIGTARMERIRDGLKRLPQVTDASISFEIPDRVPPATSDLLPEGSAVVQPMNILTPDVDDRFATTFGLHVIQGSFFSHGEGGGYVPHEAVVNEAAVKAFGWTNAIGKKVRWVSGKIDFTVAGVVKDFNYSSVQDGVQPLVFTNIKDAQSYRYLSLKINGPVDSKTVDIIRTKWKDLSPNAPFEYTFMDEKFASLYRSELQLKKASGLATVLNMVIVLMGIFGVMAFTLSRRSKEIALRKVLGADVKSIITLFIRDYAWLILIANMIAWPLAYSFTNKWLESYTYRVQQDIGPFIFVGVCTFLMAFVLIAVQCFKVATGNPVKSLRAE
jgi:ABC-type antimicrobial peptide transport system permease subunit